MVKDVRLCVAGVLTAESVAKRSRGLGVGAAIALGIVLLDRRLDPRIQRDGLVETQREQEHAVGHLVADADELRQELPRGFVLEVACVGRMGVAARDHLAVRTT